MSRHRGTITSQQLLDAGLNAFAVQLLAKSINGHGQKEKLRRPISFAYDDVVFTLSLMPDHEWTQEGLAAILLPLAEGPDSFLSRVAQAFITADKEERTWLIHLVLMLLDKHDLWPSEAAANEGATGGA